MFGISDKLFGDLSAYKAAAAAAKPRMWGDTSSDAGLPAAFGTTAMHGAAITGDVRIGSMYAGMGSDVNEQDSNGRTPLHISVLNRQAAFAEFLVKLGCNLNLQDTAGDTALHVAVKMGDVKVTAMLVAAGAKLNIANRLGKFPQDLIPYTAESNPAGYAHMIKVLGVKAAKPKPAVEAAPDPEEFEDEGEDEDEVKSSKDKKAADSKSKASKARAPESTDTKVSKEKMSREDLETKVSKDLNEFEVDISKWKSQSFSVPVFKHSEVTITGKILGGGSFKDVYPGKLKDKPVAVVRLRMSDLTKKNYDIFLKEVSILNLLKLHPNIVGILGITEPPEFQVVCELCKYDLAKAISSEPEPELVTRLEWMLDVCKGLRSMHLFGYSHGDLKPENVLIGQDGLAKLNDFGSTVKIIRTTVATTSVATTGGSARFKAPENYRSAKERKKFTSDQADIYSFGCMFLFVLTGLVPWTEETDEFLQSEYLRVWPEKEEFLPEDELKTAKDYMASKCSKGSTLPEDVCNLIQRCMAIDPAARITIDELCNELQKQIKLAYSSKAVAVSDERLVSEMLIKKLDELSQKVEEMDDKVSHTDAAVSRVEKLAISAKKA